MAKSGKRYFNFSPRKNVIVGAGHESFYDRVLSVIIDMLNASPPAFEAPSNLTNAEALDLTDGGETTLHSHPGGSGLVLGDLSTNAYYGDKGKTAYDHSQSAHAPSNAEQNVNADWNSVAGDSQILNKPTLLTLGETELTAHRGDEGHAAYDHSQDATIHLTAIQKTDLTDGGETTLHTHAASGGLTQAQALTLQL